MTPLDGFGARTIDMDRAQHLETEGTRGFTLAIAGDEVSWADEEARNTFATIRNRWANVNFTANRRGTLI